MNKAEFLEQLRSSLNGLPQGEIAERISFYEEIIDDRIEEGLSEEEAIEAVGPVNTIVLQTVAETPLTSLVKEKIRPKRKMKAWEIVLLVLGSPLWLSLLIAFYAVIFSMFVVLWSLVVTLWAVFISFIAGAVGGIAAGIILGSRGNGLQALLFVSAGLVLIGLSVYMFYISKAATKGMAKLSKKLVLGIKHMFVKKREEES
ncbi:MAG: DUF1700 domain-containing protein [Lachnospiraceae bacterium]|nr:DUF1700 domain-containing protein [Lachnospiraceae bacterium]